VIFVKALILFRTYSLKKKGMNKTLIQSAVDTDFNFSNYRMLFKGIWTGVLISLIFHHLVSH